MGMIGKRRPFDQGHIAEAARIIEDDRCVRPVRMGKIEAHMIVQPVFAARIEKLARHLVCPIRLDAERA